MPLDRPCWFAPQRTYMKGSNILDSRIFARANRNLLRQKCPVFLYVGVNCDRSALQG